MTEMRPDTGWGSAGLGLEDVPDVFGGAERVGTFSDPHEAPRPPGAAAPSNPDDEPDPAAPAADGAVDAAPSGTPSPTGEVSPDDDPDVDEADEEPLLPWDQPAPEPGNLPAPAWAPLDEHTDPLRAARDELTASGPRQVEPAQWGARAVLRRSSKGLLRPGASKAERAYMGDLETIRTFKWRGPFTAVVANKKGGAGKTPTTLLVAGVLAQVRGGGCVAFEGAEAAGTLALRAERAAHSSAGISELLTSLETVRTAAALSWFSELQSSGAAVIGSVGDRETLQGPHVRVIRDLLDQYYQQTVIDTGNDPESSAFLECISGAGALVLPTSLAMSSVVGLIDTLYRVRDLDEHGRELASSAVVIVSDDGRPVEAKAAAKARQALNQLGVGAIVDVPHDPHIGAGAEISLGQLSAASQRAWVHATAQILACSMARIHNGRNTR